MRLMEDESAVTADYPAGRSAPAGWSCCCSYCAGSVTSGLLLLSLLIALKSALVTQLLSAGRVSLSLACSPRVGCFAAAATGSSFGPISSESSYLSCPSSSDAGASVTLPTS